MVYSVCILRFLLRVEFLVGLKASVGNQKINENYPAHQIFLNHYEELSNEVLYNDLSQGVSEFKERKLNTFSTFLTTEVFLRTFDFDFWMVSKFLFDRGMAGLIHAETFIWKVPVLN